MDAAAVVLIYILMRRELNFRTRVLRMAAHDLRNPLGVIRGYAEIILQKATTPEMEREMLQRIHAKSDEIIQMVSDLLDSSVIERQEVKLDKKSLPVRELIESTLADFSELSSRKEQKLRVEVSGEPQICVDPARMKQVMVNLVSNALKYSPPQSEIVVSAAEENGKARVSVRDHGPGLSRDERVLIFDTFTKVKKPTTGGEGSTGLGLSISKSLIELNGGKIWAESDGVGKGSTFVIELPSSRELPTDRML